MNANDVAEELGRRGTNVHHEFVGLPGLGAVKRKVDLVPCMIVRE